MPPQRITPERPYGRPIRLLNVPFCPHQCPRPRADIDELVRLGLSYDQIVDRIGDLRPRARRAARLQARQMIEAQKAAKGLGMVRAKIELAAAGTPDDGRPKFKSSWERRTAAALDRLGIAWLYEPDRLSYRTWNGTVHAYIPDFRLPQLNDTYIEVKGPSGASADDAEKMRRVLTIYSGLTLLLWDAMTIEYVEDCTSADMVVSLLRTTRLAA